MDDNKYFKTKRFNLIKEESSNQIYSNELLDLITNQELKELLKSNYDLDKNILIKIDGVDLLLKHIKYYTNRFELIRLEVEEDKVTSYIEFDKNTNEPIFKFNIISGTEEDVIYEDLDVIAIYDSVNLFYKDRNLTQYVKSLKKYPSNSGLLEALNTSWKNYFLTNPSIIKKKLFRIIKSKDKHYLKSINSTSYREYGIKESFVITILELFRLKNKSSDFDFYISSVLLSESEIDLIITKKKSIEIGDIGFFKNSISIRNNDKGNTSFGVYNTLEFYTNKSIENKVFLYPKNDIKSIKNSFKADHTVLPNKFVSIHSEISTLLDQGNEFNADYHFLKDSVNYDELRHKIEEKIISRNSVFKDISDLIDLFSRKKAGYIDNLSNLISLCGKAEMLDLDYDIKSKLRYIISNVLLYGKHNDK